MLELLDSWILEITGGGFKSAILSLLIYIVLSLVLAFIVFIAVSSVLMAQEKHSRSQSFKKIAGFALKRKMPYKAFVFSLFFFISLFTEHTLSFQKILGKISLFGMIVSIMILIASSIDIASDFYATKRIARRRPLKGPLQILKSLILFVFGIVILAVLIGQSPLVLISGIGTFTAILSIVFKDALLGLVAGIQITSENLLQIGDWISIPSAGVEGTVTDIALISVKVTSFDNTVTTVPAYTFLSTPFKNWHKTINEHKRQVSFTLAIDPSSVTKEENGTNLTRFRNDLIEEIKADEHVNKELSVVVRTGKNNEGKGIPVEVFFTTDVSDYDEYCHYASVYIDRAAASLKDYELKAFRISSL
jgi:miniconductance mechanosensitive channel